MKLASAAAKLVAVAAGLALAACASAPRNAPAWYTEATENAARGYPSLQDVPRTSTATVDAAHWAQVRAGLDADAAAMRASPRAEPAPPTDPAGFVEEARRILDDTRATH